VKEGRVVIDTPRLADNGHSVPVKLVVESPMTAADHVRSITLLSGRNPRPLIATYRLGPRSGKAVVATRIRLNGTQRLVAIAQLSDGSFWSGETEVIVTESACLDAS
jgi:sulfur-oxidizing protein SoxY